MKEIPKVYANNIDKPVGNNMTYSYENKQVLTEPIDVTINKIFSSRSHVYKSKVRINNEIYDVVGKTKNSLITLDGKYINISEIKDIKII